MNVKHTLPCKSYKTSVKNGAGLKLMPPPKLPVFKPKREKSVSTTPSTATNWGPHSVLNSTSPNTTSATSTLSDECRTIIAITEGRGEARCEVGIASINISHPKLILCQISDSHSYVKTLTKVNILNPTEIVVPATLIECSDNRLIQKLRHQFPDVKITGVSRKLFNKSVGQDRIVQLCLPHLKNICMGLQYKYYALSVAAALFAHLQNSLYLYYAPESLDVSYQESEGYAIIDVSTADRLELVASTKPNQAGTFSSLFSVVNYCATRIGSRQLRSIILQPPFSIEIIQTRQACVSELIENPDLLLSLQALLVKLSNIDQLLTVTTLFRSHGHLSYSPKQLNYLLLLKDLLDVIRPLKDLLTSFSHDFYKEITRTLESDDFMAIATLIREFLHQDAHLTKGQAGENERCFAIKSGINGLLDLARKCYSERLCEMTDYVKELANRHSLTLNLCNTNAKGYHIGLHLKAHQQRSFKISNLPGEFIQVQRVPSGYTMKTLELLNYSTRLEDMMVDIIHLSNTMINVTVNSLQQYIGLFFKLCEDIATLDVYQSLAQSSVNGNYTKPRFGSFTEMTNARHPIVDKIIEDKLISNPISICRDSNVQVITGPNGSGKSIYIRQVLLLQVMAQIGCYVPAEDAIFRPSDVFFARVYLDDSIESGGSTFCLEMKEILYMINILTPSSLFIIDELCRSTSADEGTALAFAIAEKLVATDAFLFIATHYTSLAKLEDVYLNVKTWQMETVGSGSNPQDAQFDYRYRLVPGVTSLKYYGVYMVKSLWPQCVKRVVYDVLKSLGDTGRTALIARPLDEKIKLKHRLECDLKRLKERGRLSLAEMNKHLNKYCNDLQKLAVSLNFDPASVTADNSDNRATDSSHIDKISDFLKEDSGNVNLFEPEVAINTGESGDYSTSSDTNRDNSLIVVTNKKFSIFERTSTTSELIEEELRAVETGSQSEEQDEGSFNFSHISSSQNNPIRISNNGDQLHVFANVVINPGPAYDSSQDPNSTLSDSINYSPPPSPIINSASRLSSTRSRDLTDISRDRNLDAISCYNNSSNNNAKGSNSSTSAKESDAKVTTTSSGSGKKSFKLPSKFIPRKLTKRQIQEDYDQQLKQLCEMSDTSGPEYEKMVTRLMNRPSVRQVQATQHLVLATKTREGVRVLPAIEQSQQKGRKVTIQRVLSSVGSNSFDVSIFSDRNAECFEQFLNSKERDVKRFKFDFGGVEMSQPSTSAGVFNFNFDSGNRRREGNVLFAEEPSRRSDSFFGDNGGYENQCRSFDFGGREDFERSDLFNDNGPDGFNGNFNF